jgi:hypothetical protein
MHQTVPVLRGRREMEMGLWTARQQTVNNFVPMRNFGFVFEVDRHECSVRFGATGGPGILTTSRSNGCELYLPARRPRLDLLTTTQEAVSFTDDFSILPSPGQGSVPNQNKRTTNYHPVALVLFLSSAHSPALPSLSGGLFPPLFLEVSLPPIEFSSTLHHLHASTSAEPKPTAPLTKNRKGNRPSRARSTTISIDAAGRC